MLGIQYRKPALESLIDCAYSMIELGLIENKLPGGKRESKSVVYDH